MPDRDVSPLRVSYFVFDRELSQRVREWGKTQGLSVSERGRIAPQVIDAFFVANPDALAAADRIELVRATVREPGDGRATPDDYAWQDDSWTLGPHYTLTFVEGLDEGEVLRRFGSRLARRGRQLIGHVLVRRRPGRARWSPGAA
ncbi:Lsr2 family DNA-binding protein [Streptosporangium sp. OZ121]|uniref:Lsr2 family DNA-binding protein n=1 Tax=Streptosporangium sp. OZ121 TaxID=3444183 RepID=UPI003F78B5E9